MIINRLFPALLFSLAPVLAGQHTVRKETLKVTVDLDGIFLPAASHPLKIDPDSWADFTIVEVKEQGAPVRKGEAVAVLDTKAVDRAIADGTSAAKLRKLALANAERELENLETSTAWRLEVAERTYNRTREDLQYFKQTSKPLSIEEANRLVDRYERMLEYESEELSQLRKMYAEDDLTEETEEIILRRQENAVKDAEFSVKRARLNRDRNLETDIPRQAVDHDQNFKDAELAWNTQRELLPRALEQKRLEVRKLRIEDQRADQKHAEIKADRKLMDLSAPVAGRVYYGEFLHGKWNAAGAAKFMKPGGKIPAKTTFATIVPNRGALVLYASVPEATVSKIASGQKGYAAPGAAPRRRIPVTVQSAQSFPQVDNTYQTVFNLGKIPGGLSVVPGMKAKVKLQVAAVEKVLVIPAKALIEKPDGGFAVKLQRTEGPAKESAVELGLESGGTIEVLSGLKAGDVIVVPDKSKPAEEAKDVEKKAAAEGGEAKK